MIQLPEPVRRKVAALGPDGARWVAGLDELVAGIEARWGLSVGPPIGGGSGAFVAGARTGAGEPVVVKLAMPEGLDGHGPFAAELVALRLGGGHGYVRLLHADERERAMVMERLGRPLAELGLPVEAQVDVLTETLRAAWRPVPNVEAKRLRTGAEQAEFLRGFVRSVWTELGEPCPEAVVVRAERHAASREAAFDPMRSVLVHGDAHPANVLEDPSGPRFKLIDPDGLLSEPAHDLAIALRDWTDELLSGDPVADGLAWCGRLADRSGVDERAIWEWAFVERVSTGLFLLQLGDARGARFLEVAEQWLVAGS